MLLLLEAFSFNIHRNRKGKTPKIYTNYRHFAGSNLYCLDKNYGGVLIVWDRIFGTFAAENKKEQIIYGLVVNQPSFNPLHLQVSLATPCFMYDIAVLD